jgi:hypothetical protein
VIHATLILLVVACQVQNMTKWHNYSVPHADFPTRLSALERIDRRPTKLRKPLQPNFNLL